MKRFASDESGVAMTEAIIAIPFFLIVWIGLIALHQLYSAKLEAQARAGAVAMEMAVSGECGKADLDLDDMDQTSGLDGEIDVETSGMLERIASTQPFAWAHAKVTARSTATSIPRQFGGPEVEMKAKAIMMCNMKPADGLMDLVAREVRSALGL